MLLLAQAHVDAESIAHEKHVFGNNESNDFNRDFEYLNHRYKEFRKVYMRNLPESEAAYASHLTIDTA